MKDNKKILLSVLAVATLIIAIVGATFAFFSASGGSANNAVTANATTLANLGFTSSHSKIATELVPVASESPYFARYPGIAASGEHSCLDDVGNQICSIYEFTITNTASVAQTIYVSFVPSENTFDNMYFAAFNTSVASANYAVATGSSGSGNNFTLTLQTTAGNSTLGHQATKLTKNNTSPIDMPGLSASLNAGGSVTYTVLVWLQETGNDQNTEQGGTFAAGINVTTGGNSTGVTGIMGESDNSYYVYTVSSTSASIGQPIPNGMVTYTTASSAMAEFGHDFFIRHKIENDVITESYVGFVRNGTTYYLKGGDNGTSYSTNVGTLTTAFGIGNCTDYSSSFQCGSSGLGAGAYDYGSVGANAGDLNCYVDDSGESSCVVEEMNS